MPPNTPQIGQDTEGGIRLDAGANGFDGGPEGEIAFCAGVGQAQGVVVGRKRTEGITCRVGRSN